jgi:hypothetical protein
MAYHLRRSGIPSFRSPHCLRVRALLARGDGPFGSTSFGWSARTPSDEWSTGADSTGLEGKTRDTLTERRLHGKIARKGEKAPIQAGQRWHVERTNAWHNSFNWL